MNIKIGIINIKIGTYYKFKRHFYCICYCVAHCNQTILICIIECNIRRVFNLCKIVTEEGPKTWTETSDSS